MLLRVHALYGCIGPCNLSTKAKTRGTVLKPIKVICRHQKTKGCPLSQGIKKYMKILHKLRPKYEKLPKIIWLGLHFGGTQDYFCILHTCNLAI